MDIAPSPSLETENRRSFEPPKGFETRFQGLSLNLDAFEGPLDLLLHVIRSQKLDILDLPMAEVTRQYMDYLLLMEELNLEIAAEFVAMAAQLIQIKSRMLLPLPPSEEEGDPREELVQRLLDFEAVKAAAQELLKREAQWQGVIYTQGLDLEPYAKVEDAPIQATLADLLNAYRDALKRLIPPPAVEVRTPPKTLEQRIQEVLESLKLNHWTAFHDLLGPTSSREEMVLTFLALLELTRSSSIRLVQVERFGEIRIQAA